MAAGEAAGFAVPGLEDLTEIGRGGFAVVYSARQPEFNRTVAVKVLSVVDHEATSRRRFARECQAMGTLSDHPNIVTIHGAGFLADDRPYLVMAYMPNGSLQDRVERSGPVPWEEVLNSGIKLCGALEIAHRSEILHRDIKPANILVSNYGEPQLTDFGIARVGDQDLTKSGIVTASIAYAPPEVLDGQRPTFASDIYSLGATLYDLAAGRPAFVAPTDEGFAPVLRRIYAEEPPDLRPHGVPAELCAVIEKAMAKEPSARYASAAQMGRALQEAARTRGVTATNLLTDVDDQPTPPDVDATVITDPSLRAGAGRVDTEAPAPDQRGPDDDRSRTRIALAVAVGSVLTLLVVLALLLLRDGGERTVVVQPTTTTSAPSTTVEPTTTASTVPTTTAAPATTSPPGPTTVAPTTAAPTTTTPPSELVFVTSAAASSNASGSVDRAGNPVTFVAANLIDFDVETAWRTAGDGVGEQLFLQFAQPMQLTEIGLIPGYTKIDAVDGTDRFTQNRRVRAVVYTFSGGQTVQQVFSDTPTFQSIVVDVITSSVSIEIIATTDHGGRDFVAVSEVAAFGYPAA